MSCTTEVRLPPRRCSVEVVRAAVRVAAQRVGLDTGRAEDVCIVVSEAVTNAVLAHERVGCDATVRVAFRVAEGRVFEVVVQDSGPGFVPLTSAECDLSVIERDWRAEGGFGVTLMRALADEVEFIHGSGMQVCLRFALSAES